MKAEMPGGGDHIHQFHESSTITAQVVAIFVVTAGGDRVFRCYSSEREALIASSGIGPGGVDGKVMPGLALKLEDGCYTKLPEILQIHGVDPKAAAKLRENVLNKLTPAERAALLG